MESASHRRTRTIFFCFFLLEFLNTDATWRVNLTVIRVSSCWPSTAAARGHCTALRDACAMLRSDVVLGDGSRESPQYIVQC